MTDYTPTTEEISEHWVNNPLIKPRSRVTMYDKAIRIAKAEERHSIIALFDSKHSEFTYQHQENKGAYIDDCWACLALSLIKGESV